ncbi:MAG: hypothetical protein ACRCSQ_04445 [Bacteroidales bacterium]
MRVKILTGLLLMLCFTGCQKDDDIKQPENKTSFYDQSHRSYLQLSNQVKSYREFKKTDEDDIERQFVSSVSFNQQGNILTYDPTEDSDVSAFWLPVFQERYVYTYDAGGSLSEVRVFETPEQFVSYKLIYGNHSDYVLLPFEIKPVGEWLVKGLVAIESNNPDFSFTYEANQAFFVTRELGSLKRINYTYASGYPVKATIEYSEGTEIYRKENITYRFDETTGVIISKHQMLDEADFLESSNFEYNLAGLCVKRTDLLDDTTTAYLYKYTPQNYLYEIQVNGSSKNGTHVRSYQLDNSGNWTTCFMETTGFVSWEFPEGKEMLIREYTY